MSDYIIHVGVTTDEGTVSSLVDEITEAIEMNYDDIDDYDVWVERSELKTGEKL